MLSGREPRKDKQLLLLHPAGHCLEPPFRPDQRQYIFPNCVDGMLASWHMADDQDPLGISLGTCESMLG